MKKTWQYFGDVNIQYGGVYINIDESDLQYGYANAVRITPASDAGLPDNQFWVESIVINGLDDEKRLSEALNSCGYDANVPTMEKVYALMSYGYFDTELSTIVQIGAKIDPFYSGRDKPLTPDVTLRANASLRNWIKNNRLD